MKNKTLSNCDLIRNGMNFFNQEGALVKSCKTMNEAKKNSRMVQKSGTSVRRADSVGE